MDLQPALQLHTAEAVLELGVDLDVANADGNTALHYAVDESLEPVTKLLLARGANTEIKNKKGETALEFAPPGTESRPNRRQRRGQ